MEPDHTSIASSFLAAVNKLSRQCYPQPKYLLEDTRQYVEEYCGQWFKSPLPVLGEIDPTWGGLPSVSRYFRNKSIPSAEVYSAAQEAAFTQFISIVGRLDQMVERNVSDAAWGPGSLPVSLAGDNRDAVLAALSAEGIDLPDDTMASRASLRWAIFHKDAAMLQQLLDMGARADAGLLHVAAAYHTPREILNILFTRVLASRFDFLLGPKDALGRSALQIAVLRGNAGFLEWAVEVSEGREAGLLLQGTDVLGRSILHHACVSVNDELFNTILHHAVAAGGEDAVLRQLFEHVDFLSHTPVYTACASGLTQRVEAIFAMLKAAHPISPKHFSSPGVLSWTLLEPAVLAHNTALLKLLGDMLHGIAAENAEEVRQIVNFQGLNGTILHVAARLVDRDAFAAGLDIGVDPLACNVRGLSPGHIAVLQQADDLLSSWYAGVASAALPKYPEDWLPLVQFAVCHRRQSCLRTLLSLGENALLCDKAGWTASALAWFLGFSDMTAILNAAPEPVASESHRQVGHGPVVGVAPSPKRHHAAAGRKRAPVSLPTPQRSGFEVHLRLGIDSVVPEGSNIPPLLFQEVAPAPAYQITAEQHDGDAFHPLAQCAWHPSSSSPLVYFHNDGAPTQDMKIAIPEVSKLHVKFNVFAAVGHANGRPIHQIGTTDLLSASLMDQNPLSPTHAGADKHTGVPKMAGNVSLPLFSAQKGAVIGHLSVQYFIVSAYAKLQLPKGTNGDMVAPLAAKDSRFWEKTRLFGHRGSGADNAAAVTIPSAGSAAAATSLAQTHSRRTHFQENTLQSLIAAAKAGAEFVEYDVMLSRDGVPVIHHDWGVRLPSKTHMRVPVSHLTAKQFLSIPPQVMVNDKTTDETTLARAADVAMVHSFVLDERAKARQKRAEAPLPVPSKTPLLSPTYVANRKRLDELGIDRMSATPTEVLDISYSLGLRDRFVTLGTVLSKLPPDTGANIEVKYPTASEVSMFGIRPPERNYFVQRILDTIESAAIDRPIIFSSFDPDICLALSKAQDSYPVFFLTEAGAPLPDFRMSSLAAAVGFAFSANLFGIVTDVTPLVGAPGIINFIQEESGLVLASYGRKNNDPDVVSMQYQHGIGAVIADHVAHITRTLRGVRLSST